MKESASKKEVMQKIVAWNILANSKSRLALWFGIARQQFTSLFNKDKFKTEKSINELWAKFKEKTCLTDEGLFLIYNIIVEFEGITAKYPEYFSKDTPDEYRNMRDLIGTYLSTSAYSKRTYQEILENIQYDETILLRLERLKSQPDVLIGLHALFNYQYWLSTKGNKNPATACIIKGLQCICPEQSTQMECLIKPVNDSFNDPPMNILTKIAHFIFGELFGYYFLQMLNVNDLTRLSISELHLPQLGKYFVIPPQETRTENVEITDDAGEITLKMHSDNEKFCDKLKDTWWVDEKHRTIYPITFESNNFILFELGRDKARRYTLVFSDNHLIVLLPNYIAFETNQQKYDYEFTASEWILKTDSAERVLPNKLKQITAEKIRDYRHLLSTFRKMSDEIAHKIISNAYATADGFFITIDDTANNTTKKYCYAFKKDNQGRMDPSEKYKELAFVTPFDKLDLSFWDNDIYLVYESKSLFIPLSVFMKQQEKEMD